MWNLLNCFYSSNFYVLTFLYLPEQTPQIVKFENTALNLLSILSRKFIQLSRWLYLFVYLMVLNATFNNISVISWWSFLLVEETGELAENHRPVANHWQTYHIMLHTSPWSRFDLTTTSVVIGTDCIGSCKSNYHTITATTAPVNYNFAKC